MLTICILNLHSRSLNGALNGNIGVMKGCIAEITDSSNLATVRRFV